MVFETTKKMTYKEQVAFELGYRKSLEEIEKLQAENAQLKSDLDNKCDDCSCELLAERDKLKSQRDEAMELIELATNSIEKACCICKHRNNCKLDDCTNKWQWQHADRYEKLKGEVEKKC